MKFNKYFHSYQDYFWQWEDGTALITIPNDSTIAYQPFILDIIKKLAPQGLPPFGSLLLAIIATNTRGQEAIDEVARILQKHNDNDNLFYLAPTVSFLKKLANLPQEYKTGESRLLIFQAIFENCHNIVASKYAQQINEEYLKRQVENGHTYPPKPFQNTVYSRDFQTIALLDKQFENTAAILAKVSGVPVVAEPLELEHYTTLNKTELTEELIDNDKTFHVGALIKHIWSALYIPLHSTIPSQQALGGVSDLSNKGDFHQLLISEFANEDLLFLSRLANNEALYIQREIPPSDNKLERIILIDISLKNWGTPKTLAMAIMLAIAKHPKTNISCKAFVVGRHYQAIPIDNIHDIIKAVQLLDSTLHAGNGISAFFKDYPKHKDSEVFVITEASTFKQVEMLKVMNEYYTHISYWIHPDQEGFVEIYKRQQNSKKLLQRFQLPLQELWSKTAKVRSQELNMTSRRVPKSYPILVRNEINYKFIRQAPNGEILQFTNYNAVLQLYYKDKNKAWNIIAENINITLNAIEIGLSNTGEFIVLEYSEGSQTANLINLSSALRTQVTLPAFQGDFIFKDFAFYKQGRLESFCILLDGKIGSCSPLNDQLFEDLSNQNTALTSTYRQQKNLFRRITSVFINDFDRLVFNDSYELFYNDGNHIKLDKTERLTQAIKATNQYNRLFVFPDGSYIEIKPAGLIILVSSDENIPIIYVTSLLEGALGIATEEHFAGASTYYKHFNPNQAKIEPATFFVKYYRPFIAHIKNYGTQD